jgi:lipopolysaccharide heptosyltransferase II
MNILLIKPGAVGDLLQLTPVLRAVKQKFPAARITLLVSSGATASMFRHNAHVDEVIVYDRRGAHRSLAGFFSLWRQLRGKRFDLVVNYQRSNLKGWLLALAAFPAQILVYRKARGRVLHAVVNHLEAVAPLGIDPLTTDLHLEMTVGVEDDNFAADALRLAGFADKRIIALNPGASNRIKCWPPERFGQLADRLVNELGVGVVLVGGADERDLAEGILNATSLPVLDLLGKTTLLQLGALLKRCSLLVSGDTGPLHMATAVGTPVVALFGAIDPLRTGPVGEGHRVIRHAELPCVPCVGRDCRHKPYLECMELITVDELLAVVREMLSSDPSRRGA